MNSQINSQRFGVGIADLVFGFAVFCVFVLQGSQGLIDDPGLGWHLRTADAMWENGGFVHYEQFCFPSEGQPWVTRAWLSDILFRLSYGWGGLNGVAVLASLIFALTARCLYMRMVGEGVPWIAAVFVTYLAILGMSPSAVARPNLFTMLGLVWVCQICEQYHNGKLSKKKTLWLLPLFVLWPNLHGGYIAGVIVLAVTFVIECAIAIGASVDRTKSEARDRVCWLTILGIGIFLATLCNPNGWYLHFWNFEILTDPFLQTKTTVEWRPPDFTSPGWFRIELLILLLPVLLATSRNRPGLVSLGLIVVWLHFGLTSARYSPLWAIVVVPTIAQLLSHVQWLQSAAERFVRLWSEEIRSWMTKPQASAPWMASLLFALAMMLLSPWFGETARHNPKHAQAHVGLNKLLQIHRGENVFHSINWGGYLTLHGWDKHPRLKPFIDDRTDVHGQELTEENFKILGASNEWEATLEKHDVNLLCIPGDSPLASVIAKNAHWSRLYRDEYVEIYRRRESGGLLNSDARGIDRLPDTDE